MSLVRIPKPRRSSARVQTAQRHADKQALDAAIKRATQKSRAAEKQKPANTQPVRH